MPDSINGLNPQNSCTTSGAKCELPAITAWNCGALDHRKTYVKKLLPIVFLLLPSLPPQAQPHITNLELSRSSSELSRLSGENFGHFEGQVLTWDDFDAQPANTMLQALKPTTGHDWVTKGEVSIRIDNVHTHSGAQSAKQDWSAAKSSRGTFGWSNHGPYSQLYISYWRLKEGDTDNALREQVVLYGKNQAKPLEFELTSSDKYSSSGNSVCQPPQTNKFQRRELLINLPKPTLDSWLDGQQTQLSVNSSMTGITGVSLGYAGNQLAAAGSWFDDVYIANTQARVETCNKPVYTNCSRRNLQYVTPDDWSDGEIKVRLHNLRMFRGEPIYLFVINTKGQVSEGFPVARPVIKAN